MAGYTSFGYDFTSQTGRIWAFVSFGNSIGGNVNFDPVNSNSGKLVYTDNDGTLTWINGTGLTQSGSGTTISWTTLTSLEHHAANGVLLEHIDTFGAYGASAGSATINDLYGQLMSGPDVITGSSGTDALFGGDGSDVFFAGGSADVLNGGAGDDYFRLGRNDFQPGEVIIGGTGNDTLQLELVGNLDLRTGNVTGIDTVWFFSGSNDLIMNPTFGGADEIKEFVGSDEVDSLTLTGASAFAISNFSTLVFTNWTPGTDTITIPLGGGNFGAVTGTVQNDIFTFNSATVGAPSVKSGDGNDTFIFSGTSNGGFAIDGGAGTDSIKAQNVTLDFSMVTIAGIESLVFDTGVSSVTLGQAQLDADPVLTVTGSASVDAIVIAQPVFSGGVWHIDASKLVFNSWTDGVDTITLKDFNHTGVTSLIGSSHPDTIQGHAGPDSSDILNGKGGADVLFGFQGADKFVFDAVALTDAQSGIFDTIKDYNHGVDGNYNPNEGDQIDLSALLSAAYNHGSGQPVASLVRAVEDSSGTFAKLQVDPDGAANGVNWTTIARVDGLHTGNSLSIILDTSLPAGSTITVNAPFSKTSDFNGDGFSDILFRNNSTGDTGYTDIHNGGFHSLGGSPVAYSIVGAGDYNGDGFSDLLFRDNSTGDTGYTDVHNGGFHSLGGSPVNYRIVGSGDYNGDGFSDLLFRDNATGDTGYTDVHNGGFHSLGGSPVAYAIVGSGDYNGDNFSDLLFRNNSTGDTGYTDIHNGGFHSLGSSPVNYSIVGSGDYNGDHFSDLLFRDNSTGDTGYTDVHNGGFHSLGGSPVNYSIVASGDYNADGFSDLLFRDNSTGDSGYTDIHNGGFHSLGGSPAAYLVLA